MPDINEWRLEVPERPPLNFGTLASEFPFTTQFEIGPPNSTNQDAMHPNMDGEVFGIDRLGGFPIIFNINMLDTGVGVNKWDKPLDLVSEFMSMWRSDYLRRTPGAYATLSNLSRNKVVYGRPREIAPKFARIRQGVASHIATFKTNSPTWWSLTEKTVHLDLVSGAAFGFNAPLTAPLTTIGEVVDDFVVDNDGDIQTWPVIQLNGPGTGWSLALRKNGETWWQVNIEDRVMFDETLTIDTRPWSRSATINGRPANGMLRGDSITKMVIPKGDFEMRLRVKDGTGTASADVFWRDAYASL